MEKEVIRDVPGNDPVSDEVAGPGAQICEQMEGEAEANLLAYLVCQYLLSLVPRVKFLLNRLTNLQSVENKMADSYEEINKVETT